MGLFQTLRRSAAAVAQRARWVGIEDRGLVALADTLEAGGEDLAGNDPIQRRNSHQGLDRALEQRLSEQFHEGLRDRRTQAFAAARG